MANKDKVQILDSKENELGVSNESEITESNFKKLLGMLGEIDHKTLELFVEQIPNLNQLVKQNQDFILQSFNSQNKIDEKAIEEFSKTKTIIQELLKRENLCKEDTIFILKLLSETDERIDRKSSESGNRMKDLIKDGLKIGGFVTLAITAVYFSSRNDGDSNS